MCHYVIHVCNPRLDMVLWKENLIKRLAAAVVAATLRLRKQALSLMLHCSLCFATVKGKGLIQNVSILSFSGRCQQRRNQRSLTSESNKAGSVYELD